MTKDAILTVRVPQALKDALYAAATDDMRSPGSLLTKILTEQLHKSGHLKGEPGSNKRRRTGRA